MFSENAEALGSLLRQARSLPAAERAAFLRQACGTDAELYSLAISELDSGMQWTDTDDDQTDVAGDIEPHPSIGSRIGAYRVVREIGIGGMGQVLLGERDDAEFQQRVAIKLVRRGLISKQIRGRLKTERQILARLNHPNIAKLLDGGATAEGTPFIVMEYIEGRPIDAYCDAERLSVEARIALFRQVCAAVHYAHQNLIVHRDLKPSNILVTADGQPKLLDFGIAKLLDERQSAHTLAVTHADYRMLTPDHASPEQIRGDPVTTASDTYVLGIVLYELLTGRRPFNVTALRLSDIEHAICEQEPMPPSSVLEALERSNAEDLQRLAAARSASPAKLKRQIRGDLDNIVLMALRKEPERRYSSVSELSDDLEHLLAGLPVAAQPDTWSYRALKFVRRHAIAVGLSAALMVSVLAFAITTYIQAERIERQRDLVTAQREIAEQQRQRAEQVSAFLIDLFRISDPSESRASEVTAEEILDQGARKIDRELVDQPDLRATLLETIGRVYLSLGHLTKSEAALTHSLQLRRATPGTADAALASSMSALAQVLTEKGAFAEAEALQREALARIGRDSDAHNVDVARNLAVLGRLFKARGDFHEANALLQQSIDMYLRDDPPNPDVTYVIGDLALVALDRGELQHAEHLYRQALDLAQRLQGDDSLQFASQMHNLALVQQAQGRLAEAEVSFRRSLALLNGIYGEKHIEMVRAAGNYANFLKQNQRLREAEMEYRRVLRLERELRGERHSLVGYDMANLASVLILSGSTPEAERLLRDALSIYDETLPPDHPYVGAALYMLGFILADSGRHTQGIPLLERSSRIMRQSIPDTPTEAAIRSALGFAYLKAGRLSNAEGVLVPAYDVLRTKAPGSANTARAQRWLVELLERMGRKSDAERLKNGT